MRSTLGFSLSCRRARAAIAALMVMVAGLGMSACSSGEAANGQANSGHKQLILGFMAFACSSSTFSDDLCDGFQNGAKSLPGGWDFQLKTGIDFSDTNAYNALIRNGLQLKPAGIVVLPTGPVAQLTVLQEACDKGVKVVVIDQPIPDLKCASSFVAADNRKLGEELGEWLVNHPTGSKKVGIITMPPGQFVMNDDRVAGFKAAIERAGYDIVATSTTTGTLDDARNVATNLLTAHPEVGVIMASFEGLAMGALKAVGDKDIAIVTVDGSVDFVKNIATGHVSADVAQDPYGMTGTAIRTVHSAAAGQKVDPRIVPDSRIVDAANVEHYIARGGMRGK
ncbi:hypothetical protein FDG2_2523 [Candidatus Protofrankia californiensis]|uniref:Periplasmic binding protein domain-containing protein n=1 Tax=Candidatus Protofrankia californiensis TaxID=1839754 RepID=A0A1C3NXT3_9ACTN|nr:hypothetical protein FDG2_2523 [Candidatus Protofrankia californiensis]